MDEKKSERTRKNMQRSGRNGPDINKKKENRSRPQNPVKIHILDYLPHGDENDRRPIHARKPLIQAIGEKELVLLELIPKEGEVPPMIGAVVTAGGEDGMRIKKRLLYEDLSRGAKLELPVALEEIMDADTARFMTVFNQPQAMSPRLNTLNLIPGIGEKHMWDIINQGREKPFESFQDIEQRIPTLYDPKQKMIERILRELKGEEKYYLLTTPPKHQNKPKN